MTTRKRILLLLGCGMVLALAGGAYLEVSAPEPSPNTWELQQGRLRDMTASLAVLDKGGPPLLADDTGRSVGGHRYRPVGISDDQGIYVYVPVLARALGIHNPLEALKWFYVGLFAITLLIYPLIFYELFRSWPAAILSGIAALAWIRVLGYIDIYWISLWAVLTLLPVVLVLARRWPKHGLSVLGLAMIAASFATSIRSQSGLPVLLAGLILVLFMQPWRWRQRAGAALVLLVAYLSISPFGIGAVRQIRDNWAGTALRAGKPGSHLFWHTAYMGLGFGPNDYGIKWDDSIVTAAAQREKPNVEFASGEYESTLRKLYLGILKRDTGFVVATTLKKATLVVGREVPLFAFLVLVVPAALLLAPDRRLLLRWVLLLAPSLIISFLPPLIAVPFSQYQFGWLATLGLMSILAMARAIVWLGTTPWSAPVERLRGLRSVAGGALSTVARSRAGRLTAAATALGLVLAIVAVVYGPRLQRQYYCWQALPAGGNGGACALSGRP